MRAFRQMNLTPLPRLTAPKGHPFIPCDDDPRGVLSGGHGPPLSQALRSSRVGTAHHLRLAPEGRPSIARGDNPWICANDIHSLLLQPRRGDRLSPCSMPGRSSNRPPSACLRGPVRCGWARIPGPAHSTPASPDPVHAISREDRCHVSRTPNTPPHAAPAGSPTSTCTSPAAADACLRRSSVIRIEQNFGPHIEQNAAVLNAS